jgi:NAD+ kinase
MNAVHVVTRGDRPEADDIVATLTDQLSAAGIAVASDADDADLIIAIGGDGTVLSAAADAIRLGIPLCGINVGKVGYLAEFKQGEVGDLVSSLSDDSFTITSHSLVSVATGGVSAEAVNDVVVEKVISQRIIEVVVSVNHRELATYRTDGIIVASPLGSTAYSLSAGGPVVDPSLDALVLTPIAPHSLLTRPIVLAADAVVTLQVSVDRPARVNVDGRELCTVAPGEPITIRRGSTRVRFLSLGRHPFPQAVREQFGLDHAR